MAKTKTILIGLGAIVLIVTPFLLLLLLSELIWHQAEPLVVMSPLIVAVVLFWSYFLGSIITKR